MKLIETPADTNTHAGEGVNVWRVWQQVTDTHGRWHDLAPAEGTGAGAEALLDRKLAGPSSEELFARAQSAARDQALAVIERAASGVLGKYSAGEVAGWTAKEAEARAIEGGETDPAKFPMIATEADILGLTSGEVAAAVLAKVDAFRRFSGMLAGMRQTWAAAIDGTTTEAELAAVQASMAETLAELAAGG